MYEKNNGYILSYFLGRGDPRRRTFRIGSLKKKAYSVKIYKAEVPTDSDI